MMLGLDSRLEWLAKGSSFLSTILNKKRNQMFQYCTSEALYTECGLHSSSVLWDLPGSQRCQCPLHGQCQGFLQGASHVLKNRMDTSARQSFCTQSSQTSKIFAESTIKRTHRFFIFHNFVCCLGISSLVNLGMKRGTCCSCSCTTSVAQPTALSAQCWVSLHSSLHLLVLLGRISGLLQQNPFFYRKPGLLPNTNPYLGSKQAKQASSKLTAGSLLVR